MSGSLSIAYTATEAGDELLSSTPLGQMSVTLQGLPPQGTRTVTLTSATGLAGLMPGRSYDLRATLRQDGQTLDRARLISSFVPLAAPSLACQSFAVTAKADGQDRRLKHVTQEFAFTARIDPPECAQQIAPAFLWDFGNGETSAEPAPKRAYSKLGEHTATVTVTCTACGGGTPGGPPVARSDTVVAATFDASIETPSGDPASAPSAENEIVLKGPAGRRPLPPWRQSSRPSSLKRRGQCWFGQLKGASTASS